MVFVIVVFLSRRARGPKMRGVRFQPVKRSGQPQFQLESWPTWQPFTPQFQLEGRPTWQPFTPQFQLEFAVFVMI